MSDYNVIGAASSTLQDLLNRNITLPPGPLHNVPIHLQSPQEMRDSGLSGVSVWLYKVSRMSEMLNEPLARISFNQVARVPLPLQLYYLVTPLMEDPVARHTVLGRVLQVMNDFAILRGTDLRGVLAGTSEQLRVNLEALTIEELSLIWEALAEPYQLSITYLVQVVKIDSDLEPLRSSPVLERDSAYDIILSES
jgi:Pvc16 N-terminal domain